MHEKFIFIQPMPDRLVRFPDNLHRVLKEDGEYVPNSTYWRRRITGGDVYRTVPPLVSEQNTQCT